MDQNKLNHDELIRHLRGFQRIVINTCHGGFSLSFEAKKLYLELAGIEYTLDQQLDRDRQTRLGHRIMVNNNEWNSRSIDRDDPILVSVIHRLGSKADGNHANLKVVEIPPDIEWDIAEYDGNEWVEEKHRTWS